MVNQWSRAVRRTACAAALMAAAYGFAPSALADQLHLKDGRVLEGTLVRETAEFVQFKIKVGQLETIQTFLRADVKELKHDKPADAPSADPKPAADPAPASEAGKPQADKPKAPGGDQADREDAKKDDGKKTSKRAEERARNIDSGVNRAAILHFGPPTSWGGDVGSTVGVHILASAWRAAIPMLEKDHVSVVVVLVNSGGGSDEFLRFQDLFENVYEKKFRTVAWIESAISAAAMAPYSIDEIYFMPNGNFGACVGWHGDLQSMEGMQLQEMLVRMEDVSVMGKRSPLIMRAMQVQMPLSCTIDERTGDVTWFGDTTGQFLVNKPNEILTLTANDAVKYKFAAGIAATKEELAAKMGLNEVVWAGEEASRFIDQSLRDADKADKRWEDKYREFQVNYSYAEQTQDRADRGKFVGKALSALREMQKLFKDNPSLARQTGINADWFHRSEDACRRLLRRDP